MAEEKKKRLSAEELIEAIRGPTAEELVGRRAVTEKKPGIMKRIVSRIASIGPGMRKIQAKRYGMSSEEYMKVMKAEAGRRQRAKLIASIRRRPVGISRRKMVPIQRAAQVLLPYAKLRMPTYPEIKKIRKGEVSTGRGRGRPVGTYKYGMPIQQYKRLLRAARAKARAAQIIKLAQARARGITTRAVTTAVPTPESQYVPSPELQPELQAQVIQQQQQIPTPPLKRPIIPVFRSSGGHPYPPAKDRQEPQQYQAPEGYKYDTDMFTGKPRLVKLPQKERWTE